MNAVIYTAVLALLSIPFALVFGSTEAVDGILALGLIFVLVRLVVLEEEKRGG